MVEPMFSRNDGPLPTLVQCGSRKEQIEIAVYIAKDSGKTKSVAILFKNREQERLVSDRLPNGSKRLHRDMESWHEGHGIYYGTYHSAKGLEFDLVILPFLEEDNLSDPEYKACHGEEDAHTRYGRLIYVAVTRAKTELLLLYSGAVTPLLPADSSLYIRRIATR